MAEDLQRKKKQSKLQTEQPEKKKVVGGIYLNEELTLKNVIKTQKQADLFMKMLKALK
jgi:hypothetical protein